MTKKQGIIVLCVAVVWVLFMGVIFQQSGTPYKDQDMKPFLRKVIQLTPGDLPNVSFYYGDESVTSQKPYDFIEFLIRKLGHITEYTVLASLTVAVLMLMRIRTWKACLYGGIFSLFYAMTDEWHQRFIPGRTGHLIDVFTFDLFGVLLGVFMICVVRMMVLALGPGKKGSDPN